MREMKDSGFKWLGNIPSYWEVRKVKQVFFQKKEKAYTDDPTILSLARDGVKIRDISTNEGQLAADYSTYNPVEENDLLLNPMDLYSGDNCNISRVQGVISPAYVNLRNISQYDTPDFFNYYFKYQYWSMAFFAHGKGVSFDNRWTLTNEVLRNYPVLYPPAQEQKAISDILDRECVRVDSLIEKQRSIIEKLKEYKKSVITETVTKGLNPTAPMKDSGIEWIGKIPAHWEVRRFKYQNELANTGEGIDKVFWTDDEKDDYFYTAGLEPIHSLYRDFPNWKYTQDNDLLLARNGTPYVYIPYSHAMYSDHIIRTTIKPNIDKRFVRYALQQSITSVVVDTVSITTWSISIWNEQKLPFPPLSEQQAIADYLDHKCGAIDGIIEKREQMIKLLLEYKRAFIYEFVTGKKDFQ